jgi:acetylglutamate kinase
MRVKAAAIRAALYGGVGRVHVVSGNDENALLAELYTNQGAGTLVTREPEKAPAIEQGLKQVTLEPTTLQGTAR